MKKIPLFVLLFFVSAITVFSIFTIVEINSSTKRSEAFDGAMLEYREAIENKTAEDIRELAEDIKSEDEYAIVEKAAKEYLRDIYAPMKDAKRIQSTGIYKTGISISLLEEDAPDFSTSYATINGMKAKLDELQNIADNLLTHDAAIVYLPEGIDKQYISLYNEETESVYKDIALKQSYQEYIQHMGDITIHYRKIIDFLETNSSSWYIEDQTITFKTTRLSEQYDSLANELRSLKSR